MSTVRLSQKFFKDLKKLKKKIPLIENDLDHLFSFLKKGKMIGNQVLGFNNRDYEIYKARIRNSSQDSGKSGGFRVIYYLRCASGDIVALTIYSKTQKTTISKAEIINILANENLET